MKKQDFLFIVFLFLWWLDLVLTLIGIYIGRSEESNIIPKFLMERFGATIGAIIGKVLTTVFAYICVFSLLRNKRYEKAGWLSLYLLLVAAAIIVANNILVLF